MWKRLRKQNKYCNNCALKYKLILNEMWKHLQLFYNDKWKQIVGGMPPFIDKRLDSVLFVSFVTYVIK